MGIQSFIKAEYSNEPAFHWTKSEISCLPIFSLSNLNGYFKFNGAQPPPRKFLKNSPHSKFQDRPELRWTIVSGQRIAEVKENG